MSWTIVVVMMLASVGVALFVSWPLLFGRPERDLEGEGSGGESHVDQLLAQKDAVYTAIKELEFDHAMGNLSREDYGELAKRYEDRAVVLLKTIDQVSEEEGDVPGGAEPPAVAGVMIGKRRGVSTDDAIEQEVAAIRSKRRAGHGRGHDVEDEIEVQVAALRAAKGAARRHNGTPEVAGVQAAATCPNCGAHLKGHGAAFCNRCGASLRDACPGCGEPVDRDDAYCASCGSPLARGNGQVEKSVVGGANA